MVSLEHKFGKLIDMAQTWSLERRRIDALPALINQCNGSPISHNDWLT